MDNIYWVSDERSVMGWLFNERSVMDLSIQELVERSLVSADKVIKLPLISFL